MSNALAINLALTFGLPLVVFLVVFLVLRRAWVIARSDAPAQGAKQLAGLIAVLVWVVASLFTGFVGAAIIGALAPGTVGFAAELACAGTVRHSSFDYSYKPGQAGTSQEWTCTSANGTTERIVGKTFVYAGAVFSAGAAVLLGVLGLLGWRLVRGFWRRLTAGGAGAGPRWPFPGGPGSPKLDGIVSKFGSSEDPSGPAVYVNGRPVGAGVPPAASTSSGTHRSVAERLEEIEKLYRERLLTREEYEAARAHVVAEL